MNKRPSALRVGLVLDGPEVPAWQAAAVETVLRSRSSEVALLAIEEEAPPATAGRAESGGLLYRLFKRLDRRLLGPRPHPHTPRSLSSLSSDLPTLRFRRESADGEVEFSMADVAALREAELDVLVNLGKQPLPTQLADVSRYGLWFLRHGGNSTEESLVGFWEVLRRQKVCRTELWALREPSGPELTLASTYTATHPLSPEKTRGRVFWKAGALIARELERLQALGSERYFEAALPGEGDAGQAAAAAMVAPGNLRMAWSAAGHGLRYLGRKLEATFFTRQWVLLYRLGPEASKSLREYQMIVPPRDRFWADPHVVRRDDRHYVFFEEYPFATGKGVISLVVIDADGTRSTPVTVLERPYHLSYPFLLEWEGQLYMVPETAGNGTIEAYRCVKFPDQWELDSTLMSAVEHYDPTLLQHGGKWWLFVTGPAHEGAHENDELLLYYGESPIGDDWTRHPKNPIVSDARRARPAGPLFVEAGQLHRPSQDCTGGYGSGVRFNRVLKLNTEEYEEQEVAVVSGDPRRRIAGVHSFAMGDGIALFDAKWSRGRWQ